MMDYRGHLTEEQYAAVTHNSGAAFVLAGPGAGKTRCITYRIAYLLDEGVAPHNIIAITFTNKAAAEMKQRVMSMVAPSKAKRVWISTFHSMGAKMLRQNPSGFGVSANYTIADADDSKGYVAEAAAKILKVSKKEILKDKDQFGVRVLQSHISTYKYNLVEATELDPEGLETPYHQDVARIYKEYDERLRRSNLLDFDDLLMKVALGFQRNKKLRLGYARMFHYILVDEYQDTNMAQYRLLKSMDSVHQSIFAVGDADQAIYGFRGAVVENIDRLLDDYDDIAVYTLEKNFRSYESIAKVANAVIPNNAGRMEKNIVTVRGEGKKTRCLQFEDPSQEAGYIIDEIQTLVRSQKATYKDFAILYRINSRSRSFEEILRRLNIPYKVVGSLGFYQRRVIKDILAYLRLLHNMNDFAAFNRIHNEPPRGLGERGADALKKMAFEHDCSPLYFIRRGWYKDRKGEFSAQGLGGIRSLKRLYRTLGKMPAKPLAPLVHTIIEQSGYMEYLRIQFERKRSAPKEADKVLAQMELLEEFEASVATYDQNDGGSLSNYLNFVSLVQSSDEESGGNKVLLMSVHAAKGLEFPYVYFVGCNEGIIPHALSLEEEGGIEEERRIFFVGTTRAENKLTLSFFNEMAIRGSASPSRFLEEAEDSVEHIDLSKSSAGRYMAYKRNW